MRYFAYLLPGLVQFRNGRWIAGLALSTALAVVVLATVGTEFYLRSLHGQVREVAPRSVARQLWTEKDDFRRTSLMMLLVLVITGALDAVVTGADPHGRRQPSRYAVSERALAGISKDDGTPAGTTADLEEEETPADDDEPWVPPGDPASRDTSEDVEEPPRTDEVAETVDEDSEESEDAEESEETPA